MTWTITNK